MLKRIESSQVRAGMFVEAIEGSWADAFLSQRRFLLREADAQKLMMSNVGGIVINTVRGADIDGCAYDRNSARSSRSSADNVSDAGKNKIDVQNTVETLNRSVAVLGGVFDQIRSGGGLDIGQVGPVVDEISKSIDHNPAVFIGVTRLKSKDETTFLHSISVSALMIHFARYLDMDEETVQILGMSGLLHDVGKLEIPSEILMKKGGLDDRELKIIRDHPSVGYDFLKRQGGVHSIILDVCLHHHERMDGKGYPEMQCSEDISLYARLAAICDVYDAITSTRPYKVPWRPADALKWMLARDGQFDRKLLKKFAICLSLSATPSEASKVA